VTVVVNVRFACPVCECPDRVELTGAVSWECRACDHRLSLEARPDAPLERCAACGNRELYKKKDFPHTLGMTILVVACVVSFFTYGWYEKWLTWAILIGTALFDGLLYLWVGDAVVCYRCQAQYRRFVSSPAQKPFDLGIAERYRQERIRREQLQAEKKS
jgi:uncharacterized protein (DUF983 family)